MTDSYINGFVMTKRRILPHLLLLFFVVLLILGFIIFASNPIQQRYSTYSLPKHVITLDQNWTADIRQQVSFASFGSHLMPYSWFMNLELADSRGLLSDSSVLEKLGFIPQQPAENNPAGLPAGFSRDRSANGTVWVGLTCAACHARLLTFSGNRIYIDGGPGLLDFVTFEQTVYASLKSTLTNKNKFQRFAKKLGYAGEKINNLIVDLKERVSFFELRHAANETEVTHGYGRIDAFGQIFNAVAVEALGLPDNRHPPDAPVSIPALWDASHLDLVQWNASAINREPGPLAQNITTAFAVYGRIDITGKQSLGYDSSVHIRNLGYLQSQYYKLQSPAWPAGVLGELDKQKIVQGEKIYRQNCQSCHQVIDRGDPRRKLKAGVIALDEVGTDRKTAENFISSRSKTGVLEGTKVQVLLGEPFDETAQTIELVLNAVAGSMLDQPLATIAAIIQESADVYDADMDFARKAYKARPLNGVWASAPYLHNGSVPTLYDVLLPADQRPKTFYVGSRELDIVKVGLRSDYSENASFFDTTLTGNSNAGHEFGATLADAERWALVEFLKTL